MSVSRLSQRGPNANSGAKLPTLEAARAADQNVQKALESIREWLEVRLGSRGDKYEKAVTRRELEAIITPLIEAMDALGDFDGTISSLRDSAVDQLPSTVTPGAFILLSNDQLWVGMTNAWMRVTLTTT